MLMDPRTMSDNLVAYPENGRLGGFRLLHVGFRFSSIGLWRIQHSDDITEVLIHHLNYLVLMFKRDSRSNVLVKL